MWKKIKILAFVPIIRKYQLFRFLNINIFFKMRKIYTLLLLDLYDFSFFYIYINQNKGRENHLYRILIYEKFGIAVVNLESFVSVRVLTVAYTFSLYVNIPI